VGFTKRQSLLIVSRLYLHPDPAHAEDNDLEEWVAKAYESTIKVPAWQFFAALGIPGTGKSAGQALIQHFGTFEKVREATVPSKLENLPLKVWECKKRHRAVIRTIPLLSCNHWPCGEAPIHYPRKDLRNTYVDCCVTRTYYLTKPYRMLRWWFALVVIVACPYLS
jgi:hypothetical protein